MRVFIMPKIFHFEKISHIGGYVVWHYLYLPTVGFSGKKKFVRSRTIIIIFLFTVFTVTLHAHAPTRAASVYCVYISIYRYLRILFGIYLFPGSQISFRFAGDDFGNARMVIVARFVCVHDITHIHIYSALSIFFFTRSLQTSVEFWFSPDIFMHTRSRDEVLYEDNNNNILRCKEMKNILCTYTFV